MSKVVLVGTNHTIQRDFVRTDFTDYISALVSKYDVKIIAEEIDTNSVPANIAKKLNLGYVVIEPTLQERTSLGIPSLGVIENSIFMDFDDCSSKEAQSELSLRKELVFRSRENEWLKRITTQQSFPILIIFGANHFQPFSELLRQNGFEVVDECPLWE